MFVGYNNTDKNDPPTTEEFGNREHERNQVLCSSRANQQKSDQSMDNFDTNNVDSLKDMSEDDFKAREGAYKTVNEGTTVTQQTALRLQGDIQYKIKGSNETTDNPDDPNIDLNDKGLPKVADATLGPDVTADVLQKEFEAEDARFNTMKSSLIPPKGPVDDPEDIATIKDLKSKLGRRTLQAMGLPRGTTDVSGRRTNPIYGSDTGITDYVTTLLINKLNIKELAKALFPIGHLLKTEVRELAGSSKKISQQKIFDMYIKGDVEGLKGLGVKLSKEDEVKLKERGNVLGEQKEQYESLEGTISRMVR